MAEAFLLTAGRRFIRLFARLWRRFLGYDLLSIKTNESIKVRPKFTPAEQFGGRFVRPDDFSVRLKCGKNSFKSIDILLSEISRELCGGFNIFFRKAILYNPSFVLKS